MWKVQNERRDASAKRGFATDALGTAATKAQADDMLRAAAREHAATEGHTLDREQVWPGRTFIYCDTCGCAFNVGQGR